MPASSPLSGWIDTPLLGIAPEKHEAHVRYCSYFADGILDRYPKWLDGLDNHQSPDAAALQSEISEAGLDAGLSLPLNMLESDIA